MKQENNVIEPQNSGLVSSFHVKPIYSSNDLLRHKLPNATINIYFTTVFALNLLLCRNKS